MFTGIIQASGSIASIESVGGDRRLCIESTELDFTGVALGDSIAVNGVCLTAVELSGNGFCADVSLETLACTTLGALEIGAVVNLEKSLTPQTALGGHLVSGHVDGVGEVTGIEADARSVRVQIAAPQDIAKYIAAKGSICVDGTSLTVNAVQDNVFDINIIPHTFAKTLFGSYEQGSKVNLEVDIIARYVERISTYAAD
ncbi:MAG: riboflavin synthase [Gammaproteobacteria bacterium]|nr:riboflavin synthase [Gammaproteobacteria bacterium]